ncbi:MAG: hypothetical protein C0490_03535 [Marivirga sp.]|nr:hypothetical protein [Marivirga sp.]
MVSSGLLRLKNDDRPPDSALILSYDLNITTSFTANHKYVDTNQFKSFGDKLYTSDPKLVVNYLSDKYGIPEAHF